MKFKKLVILIGLSLFFSACATKSYTKQDSALIIFKTPTFKYADMGFIYQNDEALKIEIYGSGQALMSLEIQKDSVCMSLLECMSKESFNRQVLNENYPKEVLENIFRGKKIFDQEGLVKNSNGFTQKIVKEGKYDIQYNVLNNHITFHDRINAITIKVKKY